MHVLEEDLSLALLAAIDQAFLKEDSHSSKEFGQICGTQALLQALKSDLCSESDHELFIWELVCSVSNIICRPVHQQSASQLLEEVHHTWKEDVNPGFLTLQKDVER